VLWERAPHPNLLPASGEKGRSVLVAKGRSVLVGKGRSLLVGKRRSVLVGKRRRVLAGRIVTRLVTFPE